QETGTISYTDYLSQILTRPGSASLVVIGAGEAGYTMNAKEQDDPEWRDRIPSVYQTRRFGRITVIAPRQTAVYNSRLRPVTSDETDFYAASYELPRFLLATFTKAQWQKAASPEGIGAGDLTGEQATLWERMIPEPFAYKRRPAEGAESVRRLSAAERGQVRFRLKLSAQLRAQSVTYPDSSFTIIRDKQNPLKDAQDRATVLQADAPEIAEFAPPPKKDDISDEQGEWRFGQLVVTKSAYRAKPTDLRLGDTPRVSLAPPEGGKPLTVGIVVERLRVATGVEVYVHKRLAGFVVRGGVVKSDEIYPAGDVLAAIAFASESTVRRMPPAYSDDAPLFVLTRDLEPVGRQVGRISAWLKKSRKPGNDAAEVAMKQIAASDPLPLLRFDADDAFAFPQAWRDRLNAAIRADENAGYFGFALQQIELSAEQQKKVLAAIAKRNERENQSMAEGSSGDYRVSSAKLFALAQPSSSYKVPEESFLGGEIGARNLGVYGNWLPPVPAKPELAPVTTAKRALLLSADSEESARQSVRIAKRAGASALWLRGSTPAILSAATQEAGGELPVLAVVTLLDATIAPANLPRDADLFGEPSDTLLTPDDAAVVAWVTNRLLYLAAVPRLAGIVFENVLPDGYRGASTDRYGSSNGWTGGNDETGWGYTNAARRRFLRDHGADPADLIPPGNTGLNEPYSETAAFGADETLAKEWENARRDSIPALLMAARNAAGKMPVYLAGEAKFDGGLKVELDTAVFFAAWDGTGEPPIKDLYRGTWNKIPTLPDAKTGAFVAVVSPRTGLAGTELLTRTKRTDTPTLTVVDWSVRTLAEIEAELKRQKAATP
ncbi:MAG: hypothetical protein H7Y38_00650, partial [Armatimonadetes bacterium]|nr:hypothetical protein [Armatimonadota bacterium]